MAHEAFFDTNVVLELASDDEAKASRAEAVLRDGGTISVQVLNETASICLRKFRLGWDETNILLEVLRRQTTIQPVTVETHERGLALSRRYELEFYDSCLLAAALLAGCTIFYSQDLHEGLVVDQQLRIVNPFRLT